MGWEWHDHNRDHGRFAELDPQQYAWVHIRLPAGQWRTVKRLANGALMSASGYMAMVVDEHISRMAAQYTRAQLRDSTASAPAMGGCIDDI